MDQTSWQGRQKPCTCAVATTISSVRANGDMGNGLPTFEITSKPWFGPKKRAKEMLDNHRAGVLPAGPKALRAMQRALGAAFEGIQHVRFIDFEMNGTYRYTLAICWTASQEGLRNSIYELGADCIARTGWYPLPLGERLKSAAGARILGRGDKLPEITAGSLRAIGAAVDGSDAGTSVRVTFTDGATLLLDSGFGTNEFRQDSDRLVLVSHHHRDHIGGVENARLDGLPVGIPRAAAVGLHSQGRLAAIQRHNPIAFLEPDVQYHLGKSISLTALAVPHMPGSVGYLLDDGAKALLYTGDIALRSSRHDTVDALLAAMPLKRRGTILLDATMAGRTEGVSQGTPAKWVVNEATALRDVAVVAHHDHLLYAYLDVFHTAKSGSARRSLSFVVTGRIRSLFCILHDAFIRRELQALDPFVAGQYGRSMSAWGESRWLYWFDAETQVPSGPRVWFLTPEELDVATLPDTAAILTVGRVKLPRALPPSAVDTTPWTGHSDQQALADGVRAFEAAGHDVVLFHNFRKRLSKFSRDHGFGAKPLRSEVDL